ncbi:MAG: hypothetical protein LBV13_03730, partial [Methanomassiliicoccaceae archaeon]|nr:hypothetical protein [Methanomassiliicoccaceae archaeon]
MSLEERVLERIRPSDDETAAIMDTAERLKERVVSYLASYKHDIRIMLVGSVAKGTFLSGPDLD